jgi:hypothetical protein
VKIRQDAGQARAEVEDGQQLRITCIDHVKHPVAQCRTTADDLPPDLEPNPKRIQLHLYAPEHRLDTRPRSDVEVQQHVKAARERRRKRNRPLRFCKAQTDWPFAAAAWFDLNVSTRQRLNTSTVN